MLHCITKYLLDRIFLCIDRFAGVIKTSYKKVKYVVKPGHVDFEDFEQKLLGYPLFPLDDLNYIVHVV